MAKTATGPLNKAHHSFVRFFDSRRMLHVAEKGSKICFITI